MRQTSIKSILRNVTGSCDFGMVNDYPGATMSERRTNFWKAVIVSKSKDTGFGHLVDSIIEHGFRGDVSAVSWKKESPCDSRRTYINEGHHRLVAAILLGLDTIPTTDEGTSPDRIPGMELPKGQDWFSAHWCDDDEHPIYVSF